MSSIVVDDNASSIKGLSYDITNNDSIINNNLQLNKIKYAHNQNESSESNVIVVNDINGDFTTADKPIPQTGDASKIIIGSSIVLIVAGYVLFRKYKNTQIK